MAHICTITCHDVCNHGASLQAYALMKYLHELGHHVEIIDYKPGYLDGNYGLWSIHHPNWKTNLLRRILYRVIKYPFNQRRVLRRKAFSRFTEKHLRLTTLTYKTNEELQKHVPEADLYICGSDQIWNCLFPNGKDPAFYLDFVPKSKLRISYAASFGTDALPTAYREFVQKKVSALNYVSVRESTGLRILEGLGINNAIHVVDPVFLLNPGEWVNLSNWVPQERYVLVYDFERSHLIRELAMRIAGHTRQKIYSVDSYKCSYADRNFATAAPDMFVSLIGNASLVISNSFHATAFSLILQKNFIVTNRVEHINTRMHDLLASLGLQDHILSKPTEWENPRSQVDSPTVSQRLFTMISQSKQYLQNGILAARGFAAQNPPDSCRLQFRNGTSRSTFCKPSL